MIPSIAATLALAWQASVPALPAGETTAMPVFFSIGGDDGLTQRFAAMLTGGGGWMSGDCSTSCLSITIDQVTPDRAPSFRWRIEVNQTSFGGRSATRLDAWTGTCREREIAACAREIRTRIDAVARRQAGSVVTGNEFRPH